jgi:4-hydroxythreonine-4-phosphate dehydrogenase
MTRTPIALTCGDPAGIGPELAVKAWNILRNELVFLLDWRPAPLAGWVPLR